MMNDILMPHDCPSHHETRIGLYQSSIKKKKKSCIGPSLSFQVELDVAFDISVSSSEWRFSIIIIIRH